LIDYALLGPGRSLDRLAERYRSERDPIAPTQRRATLAIWSSDHDWQARVAAYDDSLAAAVVAEAAADWQQRQAQIRALGWEIGQAMIERAREMLAAPLWETEQRTVAEDGRTIQITIVKPARWALRDVVTVASAAIKLGRLAAGLDTERVRVVTDLNPSDLANLSDSELAALAQKLEQS
jgi:hypothetical protein